MRIKQLLSATLGQSNLILIVAMLVLPGTVGCSRSTSQPEVLVFAAASSNESVNEICQLYESQSQESVNVGTSFAGSSTLATQILNGADADLFLSANLLWVEQLEKIGAVKKVNKTVGNQLVVISSVNGRDSDWVPSRLADLADARVKRIAIADPDSVPAGMYAKTAMEKLEVWQAVKPKLVYGIDVRQTLAHVENAAVDFGVVYRTDANISSHVKVVFEIPIDLTGPIEYGLVLTTHGHDNPASRRFFEFMDSDNSKRIFEKHGFIVTGDKE